MEDSWKTIKENCLSAPLEEKRLAYKCGPNFLCLEEIPILYPHISALKVDITTLEVDAIVCATNSRLKRGGGVNASIRRGAGDMDGEEHLQNECDSIGGCPTGQAVITGGYKLPCRYVIHTVGPVVMIENLSRDHSDLLASCYTESLNLAKTHGLRSIAFPCIATGTYRYPKVDAANVAIETVKRWLNQNPGAIDRVIFTLFAGDDEVVIYENSLKKHFT